MPKGSKPCKVCATENPLRVSVCKSCNAPFSAPAVKLVIPARAQISKPSVPNNEEDHVTKPGMHHILVPAGKCPFQFSTEEEIETWVNKIKAFGANKGQTYDPGALVYWAGTFIDKFSNKGRELIDKLKTFLSV